MATAMSSIEARRSTSPQATHSMQTTTAANALSKLAESDSDSDNDEALVQRTTGRLLSRLQRRDSSGDSSEEEEGDIDEDVDEDVDARTKRRLFATKNTTSDGEKDEDNGQAAYERMKQQLMAKTSLERRLVGGKTQAAQTPAVARAVSDDEDGDDAPVRANRIQKPIPALNLSSSESEDEAPVLSNRLRKPLAQRQETASPPATPSPHARSRQPSPGLFVTPEPSPAKRQAQSDDIQSSPPGQNADFRERVERIRAERLAKRQKETHQRKQTAQREDRDEIGSNSDGENSRRLTQLAKPTRKAGKKALEAMARDQQRIARGMQLNHQAKTKKRYGTKDLFAKFGFNQGIENSETTGLPTPVASSVPATSDAEAAQAHDTPPTSPPSFEGAPEKGSIMDNSQNTTSAVALERLSSPAPAKIDKGKGRAPEFQHLPPNQMMQLSRQPAVQTARVEVSRPVPEMVDLDSDDDLEIVKPKSRFPIFDKIPARKEREPSSLLHLRHLAQLTSPGKKGPKGKNTMNMAQLAGTLAQKARQQAQKERQEKIEMLRAKGIIIETEEEREKRQMEIEDLVAQFEREKEKDLKLAKREREIAKKNGEAGDGLVSSDEEEDDDYVASGGEEDADDVEQAEDVELELSGSEDEEADDEEDFDEDGEELEEDAEATSSNALIDTMADENDEEKQEPIDRSQDGEDDDMLNAEPEAPARKVTSKRARKVVVDEDDEEETPEQLNPSPTQVATQDETMAAFGFDMRAPGPGLTQAFAGTMANLGSNSQVPSQEVEQDSIDFLRSLPDSQPTANFSQRNDFFVPNSQVVASQQEYTQDGPVAQMSLGISQLMEETTILSHTQISEVPEPTQDAGFLLSRSPAGLQPSHSTVDTVMLEEAESPIAQRKGKLSRRRKEAPVVLSDADDDNVLSASDIEADAEPTASANAFNVLKKAARKQKKIDNFNKKTSAAREHLDEQAYESDDEYKGLGGASDEDNSEDDADLEEMIDTTDIKVDERKLAALYADKARKEHDASVAKIYKDLQTGAFRKRGVGDAFNMSDSEDELEMRRRKKQREFDRMVRELKADETVGKLAENPKRKAFFASLMDRSDDEDLEFLDEPEEPAANSASQSDEEKQDGTTNTNTREEVVAIPDSQTSEKHTSTTANNPLKRKSPTLDKENRPPPSLRRTTAPAIPRRPISAADIQLSVAELLDDPRDVLVPDSQYTAPSDSEDDDAQAQATRAQRVVTNRLSRTSSSSTTTGSTTSAGANASVNANMAFHAPAYALTRGFRVPSLIHRATSNLSTTSTISTSTSRSSSRSSFNKAKEAGVRRGGTGKSNIHAQAREAERRTVLEKTEGRRREEIRRKAVMGRKGGSVLGGLGMGGFE